MAKSYISANIENDLHVLITDDAKRAGISFSEQIRQYRTAFCAVGNKKKTQKKEVN